MKEFSATTLEQTKKSWENIVNDDEAFFLEYSELFKWAENHIEYENDSIESYAYGIFNDSDDSKAYAIVDIIQQPHGKKTTKLLKLDVSPCLSDEFDLGTLSSLSEILSAALMGAVAVSGKNSSDLVKIYGRNAPMLGILRVIEQNISAETSLQGKIKAKIAGRWLEISLA